LREKHSEMILPELEREHDYTFTGINVIKFYCLDEFHTIVILNQIVIHCNKNQIGREQMGSGLAINYFSG